MTLTEIQLPSKQDFYREIQREASNLYALMERYEAMADFLERMGAADLDAMGVPAGTVRSDLVDFRVMAREFVDLFGGVAVTPTKNPKAVVDEIRRMIVI